MIVTANVPLSKDKKEIAEMFDSIAPKYDFLNHLLSFNIDRNWRRKLLNIVGTSNCGSKVLDIACGTGDISRGLSKRGYLVTGMDISENMLKIAREKSSKHNISYIQGSADKIPFENDSFSTVTISFGIRNFDNRRECIDEIYRVIAPGGRLAILEFAIPKNKLWRSLYKFYILKLLPSIGKIISGKKYPYQYLPASTIDFPQREAFCEELKKGRFINTDYKSLTGGVACIYTSKK